MRADWQEGDAKQVLLAPVRRLRVRPRAEAVRGPRNEALLLLRAARLRAAAHGGAAGRADSTATGDNLVVPEVFDTRVSIETWLAKEGRWRFQPPSWWWGACGRAESNAARALTASNDGSAFGGGSFSKDMERRAEQAPGSLSLEAGAPGIYVNIYIYIYIYMCT